MKKIYPFIFIAIISIIGGAFASTLAMQNGMVANSIPANNDNNNNELGVWIPISSFANIKTTLADVQEKLTVPFKTPSDSVTTLGMTLNMVLASGSEKGYYIVYLIYGPGAINIDTMSVTDIVNSGHVVVIQTDSGLTASDIQGLYNDVSLGISPGESMVTVNNAPAILSSNQIAIFQGSVIYNILFPNTITSNQVLAFADSMFK